MDIKKKAEYRISIEDLRTNKFSTFSIYDSVQFDELKVMAKDIADSMYYGTEKKTRFKIIIKNLKSNKHKVVYAYDWNSLDENLEEFAKQFKTNLGGK